MKKKRSIILLILLTVVLAGAAGGSFWYFGRAVPVGELKDVPLSDLGYIRLCPGGKTLTASEHPFAPADAAELTGLLSAIPAKRNTRSGGAVTDPDRGYVAVWTDGADGGSAYLCAGDSPADCRFYYQASGSGPVKAYDLQSGDETYERLLAVLERMTAYYEE